jgi:endonuclease YncB( thermonuclease family)
MNSDHPRPILAPDPPDPPEPDELEELLEAEVRRVFDGDGFLAAVWDPQRRQWVDRVPFRFAFIDAPEMEQAFGPEAKEFLHKAINGKKLKLALIGKQSTGYRPLDHYQRLLCVAYLTEEVRPGAVEYFLDGKFDTGVVKSARDVTRNVELEMIINGWAWVTRHYASDREEEYLRPKRMRNKTDAGSGPSKIRSRPGDSSRSKSFARKRQRGNQACSILVRERSKDMAS